VTNTRSSARGGHVYVITACAALACIFEWPVARAAIHFEPFASVTLTHNSNVFSRPKDEPPFAVDGNTALGDTIRTYLVGATADFDWGLNRLLLSAAGSRLDYNRFSVLDHNESRLAGTFDWYLSSFIDGDLTYSQKRTMSPLADSLAETLELQTEKIGNGTVRIHVTPRWRLDLQPTWHQLESPLQEFPDFGFRESGGSVSINYVGIKKLVAGLRESYISGSYHGIVAATKYHQTTTELTAHYAVSGFSSFDGQVGYTRRTSSLANPDVTLGPGAGLGEFLGTISSYTYSLGFHRQLSVKTGVSLLAFRTVDSYVAGANSQISTGGEANVKWEPDVRFSVSLRYRMVKQSIEGALAISNFQVRTDRYRVSELDIEYRALKWLTLRPYVQREIRASNIHEASYNSTIVGIDLTARWNQHKPIPAP
jgi:hypothetical protein